MLKLSLQATLAAVFAGAAIGQAPMAINGPFTTDAYIDLAVLDQDFLANPISAIHSAELRPMGGGLYYVCLCANVGATDTHLITGVLDMTQPPTAAAWTPNDDVGLINMPGGGGVSQFQLSISPDLLVITWDSYTAVTYGTQTGNTFLCTRSGGPGTQFQTANVRAVTNVSGGGIDPHMGTAVAGSATDYWLYGIDFTSISGSIVGFHVNTSTGVAVFNQQILTRTTAGFYHSHRMYLDSTGESRALVVSDYPGSGGYSDWVVTEGVHNDGTPETLIDGSATGFFGAAAWCNNPPVVGGRFSMCTDGALGQWAADGTLLANVAADAAGNAIMAGWSPLAPGAAQSQFMSAILVGPMLPIGVTVTVPGITIIGDLWNGGSAFPLMFHDTESGLAELALSGLSWPTPLVYDMQMATLDLVNLTAYLSNSARFDI